MMQQWDGQATGAHVLSGKAEKPKFAQTQKEKAQGSYYGSSKLTDGELTGKTKADPSQTCIMNKKKPGS